MIIRSKAPFRLGLAGGGTDVSPYSDQFGGAILNATINLFARTTIVPTTNNKIVFHSVDNDETYEFETLPKLPLNDKIDLQIGIYNRIIKDFNNGVPLSFELTTSMDVPTGSGLGTSSTLAVSVIGAFVEWLQLPLGEYDIAQLAYDIERNDLKMAGGKQDQYAATFGGVNFMEFYGDRVVVNPLRIKKSFLNEIAFDLILYYTKTSRESAKIIEKQIENVKKSDSKPIEAMHALKKQAFSMKEAFLKSEVTKIGQVLHQSWVNKKQMASGISNKSIDHIYDTALKAGAVGGKISGAGGGGFMMFFTEKTNRYKVVKALEKLGGEIKQYEFTHNGLFTWTLR
ncbi:MAG TPA: dehydrogenase [Crocinitomix sp.]|nr:dehydrogenase [Crocinitomix sp.]